MSPVCSSSRILRAKLLGLLLLFSVSGTVWTQTQGTAVTLQMPAAIAYDAQGNLYIAERGANVVRRLATDGSLTAVIGTGVQGFGGDGGPGGAALLDSPAGLAVDSAGDLFVSDTHNHRVRKLDAATGLMSTVAGTGVRGFAGDGSASVSARLDSPTALALAANGDLYVADTGNHRIRKVAAETGVISTVVGNGTQGFSGDGGPAVNAALDSPSGIAVDADGSLYLADTHNQRVRRVDAGSGLISTLSGVAGAGAGLPVDSGDGGPATGAALARPLGVTVGPDGSVYVASSGGNRIRRIAADGTITTVAGMGAELFAGDGGQAVAAALDTPGAVTVSPGGLVTLADTGNARVRQVDRAATPEIHTIAGLGPALSSGGLSLAGPATVTYGSGSVTATLTGGGTGSVTFLDSTAVLGTASLTGGSATVSIATLGAGTHTITAGYAGDPTHGAVQLGALQLVVTPRDVTATAQPVSLVYGQAVPAISGVVNGILAQDSGRVTAVFNTPAVTLSPVGAYAVSARLSGPAAANYLLGAVTGGVAIARAPTATTAVVLVSSAAVGDPVVLGIRAVSSTTGTPTGSVTVLDEAAAIPTAPLATVPLASGSASASVSSLSAGSHLLAAVYAGDANFLGSSSPLASVTIAAGADFSLEPTGTAAQSIPSGSTATFSFSVGSQGGILASPISLSVDGLPLGATASMNPAYLPPGGQVTAFTLAVQTTKAGVAQTGPAQRGQLLAALVGGPILMVFSRRRNGQGPPKRRFPLKSVIFASMSCILFATLTSGCGNRVNTGTELHSAPTYTLTVTGTATSASGSVLKHSATVTLQVL